ncbi:MULTISPECIES: hypothetical protein [Actinoalloteichus]|uniref:Uncharacterized protein n=1 Tax=Actinoalloteichus fjordicus TaxID=1612552 RepID=A0AAC9PRK8_9PSEU|nr:MULTISPECIES: hypothetical protein [Actinoalloteichus]APU13926.1 hypothetical protein UA74_09310 [Actinoalloteichus fjordicus]APU19872.1 hypothetical protein UA75_09280 [Actinoalloteichus sp. GBA129-24]
MSFRWFVRSLSRGDTHLGRRAEQPAPSVAALCDPELSFAPLNRRPLAVCFFDWQVCLDCLTADSPAVEIASPRVPGDLGVTPDRSVPLPVPVSLGAGAVSR